MRYADLEAAFDAYAEGRNVTQTLREIRGESGNTNEIIEIAYDMQAGSYVAAVNANMEHWQAYCGELGAVLYDYVRPGDRLLDAGTGEMTTLVGVAAMLPEQISHYAFDISWSRLDWAQRFVDERWPRPRQPPLGFVADFGRIPLADRSIDVVWTSHAIEPNGGRERQVIAELFRVARRCAVLFEPSYEHNTREGRERMDRLGYVRGLSQVIAGLGWHLEATFPIASAVNPLNPTYAYVAFRDRKHGADTDGEPWQCPATGAPLRRQATCYWSPRSRLAYPIIDGIPVLRADSAVLATSRVLAPSNETD